MATKYSFPHLVITADDVSGSWNKWYNEFVIAMELAVLESGMKKVTVGEEEREVSALDERTKLLLLLKHIGQAGRDTLTSQGFVASSTDANYDEALKLLQGYYEREESMFVRVQKFVSASQTAGEDVREYLLRVERLSRQCGYGTDSEEVRLQFCVALAVNGLRDMNLRRELMARKALSWTDLGDLVRSAARARDETSFLATGSGQSPRVKVEPAEVASMESEVREERERHSPSTSRRREGRESGRAYRRRSRSSRRSGERRYDSRGRRSGSGDRYSDRDPSRSPRWTDREQSMSPRQRGRGCYECHRNGHISRYCPDARCYNCNRRGHQARDCPSDLRCWDCGGRHLSAECDRKRKTPPRRSPSPRYRKSVRFVSDEKLDRRSRSPS
jgi:hypothetical protein